MRLAILIFLGALGSFTLLLTLLGGVVMQLRGQQRGNGGLIDGAGGILSALIWGLFSIGATNITQLTETGTVVQTSSVGLSMVGVVMAALSIILGLFGVVILVDVSSLSVEPRQQR